MKGSHKLWIGVLIVFLVSVLPFASLMTEPITILGWVGSIAAILILGALAVLQICGLILLIFIPDNYNHPKEYGRHSIYKVPPESIPDTYIGYIQLPVMTVKGIKLINRWADRVL